MRVTSQSALNAVGVLTLKTITSKKAFSSLLTDFVVTS
jgi:hypothetical protein